MFAAVTVRLLISGVTEAGTLKVKLFVAEPTFVLPLYVSSVTFTVALVAFGITLCAGVYPVYVYCAVLPGEIPVTLLITLEPIAKDKL